MREIVLVDWKRSGDLKVIILMVSLFCLRSFLPCFPGLEMVRNHASACVPALPVATTPPSPCSPALGAPHPSPACSLPSRWPLGLVTSWNSPCLSAPHS